MPTPTEKWLQQIANRQGTKKSALTMDSPSASLFPPLALTYIPCCYSPSSFLRPVLLPLMPLAPAPVDVPGPAAHHQQHHLPTQPLSPPYVSQISIVFSIIVLQLKLYHHHGLIYQRIRVPDARRSRFAEMKATQQICTHSNTSHSALMSHVRVSVH